MRILPILICVSVALFTVKLGRIWQGVPLGGSEIAMGQALAAGKDADSGVNAKMENSDAKSPLLAAKPAKGSGKSDAGSGLADDPRHFTLSEIRLLQALSKRRKTLESRERELAQRQALLKAAEQQLVSRRAELVGMKQQVERLLKLADKKEISRINNLVKIYENMKPRDAAVIFNGLEQVVVLELVERMKVRKAAPVIAAMQPLKARRLTKALAARRKGPGSPERGRSVR